MFLIILILSGIQERDDIPDYSGDSMGEDSDGYRPGLYIRSAEDEIAALRAALSECWTLCNTLAGLSYIHRQKMFEISGAGRHAANSMEVLLEAVSKPL